METFVLSTPPSAQQTDRKRKAKQRTMIRRQSKRVIVLAHGGHQATGYIVSSHLPLRSFASSSARGEVKGGFGLVCGGVWTETKASVPRRLASWQKASAKQETDDTSRLT